ncbi:MAG: tail tube protein [Caudoviricetes sp.]|nr:MAG: tail tube protein [Caudoviricetes sp.]
MTIRSQGTDLYAIDPADGTLIDVGCITSLDGIDTAIDQIETTCLNNLTRTYEAGLATPGAATFGLQFDPSDAAHIRLHQLKTAGTTLQWAVGFSDGIGVEPTTGTDSSGAYEFVLPPTRSWLTFEGYMNSYPFTFGLNTMVTSTVGIQVSGEPVLLPKSSS